MSPALLDAARDIAADLALDILRDMPRAAVVEHLDQHGIPRDDALIAAVLWLFEIGDIDIEIRGGDDR